MASRADAEHEFDPSAAAILARTRSEAMVCTRCPLSESRTQVVYGAGNPAARLMIVGEAPGADEDAAGLPFVGRSGRKLDGLLAEISLTRSAVYISNVVMCRPPGNDDPKANEIAACASHLDLQIDLVQPRVIIAVGGFGAGRLLGMTVASARGRGWPLQGAMVVVTWHPSGLNRGPERRQQASADFRLARELLGRAVK